MTKTYRGPLAWLRRWNHRRLESRRWRREALEALVADDVATLEALSRLLEQGRAEAAFRAEGHGEVVRRLDALASDIGGRLRAVEALAAAQAARLEGMEARRGGAEAVQADGFPLLTTGREGLLEPELEVLARLAPALAPRIAIDVGAHHGRFTRALLDLGFEVHALEPNPEARAELVRRLGDRPGFTAHAGAAGAEDGWAELGLVTDRSGHYADASQFASLAGLPLPVGLEKAGTVRVPVHRLDSLVGRIGMAAPSVVKVDAEGTDLDVLRGLGDLRPAVLLAEFWDVDLPFSAPGARNRLPDLVAHARSHGAPWHLVVFRRWGDARPAFYGGWAASPERSWGNVLFFADRSLYEQAREVLAGLLPEARFVGGPGA